MTDRPTTRRRARMGAGGRRLLVGATALFQIVVGTVVLVFVVGLAASLGLDVWALLLWVPPTVFVTRRAVRSETPARVEDDQLWTEYVLRATLIGSGRVRSKGVRFLTGAVLGGPLAVFVALVVIFDVVGSLGI